MNDQLISNAAANGGAHSLGNQNNHLLYEQNFRCESSPKQIIESVNVHVIDSSVSAAPSTSSNTHTQLIAKAPPTITVTPTDEPDKTIDGMLDRISSDLDYLLNRMADIPPVPPPPTSTIPSTLSTSPSPSSSIHPTNLSVHEVILEEEAEDL